MSHPSDPPAAPLVEVRGLVRSFGSARAVDGLDLEVRRGECLGLLGPNGAGKTTTLRVLSTLLKPSAGHVRVLGCDPAREGAAVRARLGVVPQEIALYPRLSAVENLRFFGRMAGVPAARLDERVAWGLEVAGLEQRGADRVREFSGGMRRRLNLVVALLHEPELCFLDEPTVGIDPQSRNHVFETVERLRAEGLTMIYTTHQLGEVERLCDRIVVMDEGRAIASGSLDELRSAQEARVDASGIELPAGADLERAVQLLREGGIEARLGRPQVGLEEIFLALTGKELRDDE